MKRINKIISSVILICFMLNTAVSDFALAGDICSAADTIGVGSRFTDIAGSTSADELKIAVEVQTLLRKYSKNRDKVELEDLAKQIKDSDLEFSMPSVKLFTEKTRPIAKGCAFFQCSVKNKGKAPVTYYALFSLRKKPNG